jgi:hypothetical protein
LAHVKSSRLQAVKKTVRYKEHKNHVKWTRSYLEKLERFKCKNHDIIYMDETGFAPGTSRTHGYGIVGKRIYGNVDTVRNARVFLSLEAI